MIEGTDQGGITKAVKWKGGGGFRYYGLAPSLLEKDKFGNWVISKQYNAATYTVTRAVERSKRGSRRKLGKPL